MEGCLTDGLDSLLPRVYQRKIPLVEAGMKDVARMRAGEHIEIMSPPLLLKLDNHRDTQRLPRIFKMKMHVMLLGREA